MKISPKYIPNSILRQVGFITIAIFLLIVVLKNMASFIPGVLGAFCMYVLLIHPLSWMEKKWKMKRFINVIILMLVAMVILGSPILLVINMLKNKVNHLLENRDSIQANISNAIEFVETRLDYDLLGPENMADITQYALKIAQALLNTSLNSLLQLGVAFLILYFMLMNCKKMENWFYVNIPLREKNIRLLNKELRDLVISNAVGVPLVAILQGLVAYLGYWIFGLDDAFSWFVLTAFASMVPVLGAALVYVPAGIYMIASGDVTNGYLLLAYCFIIVGTVDNIFRFLAQKMIADVHPLITIFGVVVGVNLFGFIGIIFGPILLSSLFWLYKIYQLEFSSAQKEQLSQDDHLPPSVEN